MSTVGTFQGIIDQLTLTVQRDELLASYLDIANRAVRELAIKHSFVEMKAIGAGAVLTGFTRAALPADFKELQSGRFPIFDTPVGSTGALVPVYARSEVEKLLGAGLVPAASFIYTQDFTGGVTSYRLDLPSLATVDHALVMYYFAYPAACTDPSGGATTPLITNYFNLVLLKALSIAFESINDPVYLVHEKQFISEFSMQTGEDVKGALAVMRVDKPA